MSLCWDYFPESRGLVSGIIVCGFGLGSFVFNFVSTRIVNPENLQPLYDPFSKSEYYDSRVASRVPSMI